MAEVGPDHLLGTAASVMLVPGMKVHDAHTLVKGQWAEFIKERDGVVKLLRTKYDAFYKNTALRDDLPADWLQQKLVKVSFDFQELEKLLDYGDN